MLWRQSYVIKHSRYIYNRNLVFKKYETKKKFRNQKRWRMREKHQKLTPEAQTTNGHYPIIFIKLDQGWFKFD